MLALSASQISFCFSHKTIFRLSTKPETMYSPAKTQDSCTSDRPESPTQVFPSGQQTQDSNDSSTWSPPTQTGPKPEQKVIVSRPETRPPVDFQALEDGDFQVPGHVMVTLDEMRSKEEQRISEEQERLFHVASNNSTLQSSVKPDEEKVGIANRLVMEMLKRDEMKVSAAKKTRTKPIKATEKKKQTHTKKRKSTTAKHTKKSSKKKLPTTPTSNPITNYVTTFADTTPSVTTPSVTNSIPFSLKVPFATPSPSIATKLNTTPGFECKGCGGTAETCKEIRWKWICLHRVLDYFEKVGSENVEVEGATNAYVSAYHVLGKLDLLNKHSLYSTNPHFSIPQCMVHGSYQMAIDMTKSQKLYCVLMKMRVNDVDDYLGYKVSAERLARDGRDGE